MMQVYREFYPKKEDYVTLECVWNTDKFVLAERMNKCEIEMPEGDNGGEVSVGNNAMRYQSIESFLGGKNIHHIFLFCILFLLVSNIFPLSSFTSFFPSCLFTV